MKEKQSRRISASKLRKALGKFADDICAAQERVTIALSGNTFEIHLEGGSINITINERGGEL